VCLSTCAETRTCGAAKVQFNGTWPEDFQLEVLRGRHLLEAFKECVREGKIIDKADEEDIPCGNENVRFVERLQCSIFVPANDREDTRITESEKLAIASHYNSIDSVSCEMTFMDNMSLSLQYVRSKLESYGRRAHMDDSMREGASNMTIWSDLKKITDAAVQVCLIGYSKTSHCNLLASVEPRNVWPRLLCARK